MLQRRIVKFISYMKRKVNKQASTQLATNVFFRVSAIHKFRPGRGKEEGHPIQLAGRGTPPDRASLSTTPSP
jgi:hypothetical protein